MNKGQISIIIPIYNVAEYLTECVESVCKQTYEHLQIILVDDGSTDDCGKLCDHLAKMDSRIVLIHKKNGGLSDARNCGLDYVTGEFIFYLDSDDYLELNAMEDLMKAQKSCNADVVQGNYYYTYYDHEEIAASFYKENTELNNYDAMEALVIGKIQNFAWGKLIRSDIAVKHRFPKGKLFEDSYWAHFIFADVQKMVVTNTPLVHYRQRKNSISYTLDSKRLELLEGWLMRKQFLEEKYPDLIEPYMEHIVKGYLDVAWLILTRMKSDRRKAVKRLRNFSMKTDLKNFAKGEQKRLVMRLQNNIFLYVLSVLGDKVRRGKEC